MKRLLSAMSMLCLLAVAVWAEPIAAGTYKGNYEGSSGSAGDIRVVLKKSADGAWTGEAAFWLQGSEVACKVTSVKVDGSKLRMVYTFDLQGTNLESMIEGELNDGKLTGKYRTQLAGEGSAVDEGTWTSKAS